IDTQLDGYDLGSPQANTVIMYNAALDGQESTGIDATTFNTNVTATATNAGVAAAAADLAYNWAQQAEDVEVAAGEYSAYHWAQKAEAAGGVVVQVVSMSDGHVGTGANLFSFDDVIPTNSEGDYLMGLQITPTHATNLLRVDVVANLSHSDDGRALSIGLFQNGITNALACVSTTVLSRDPANLVLTYWMPAGTTNQIAFIVNGGANSAGTTTFNGVDGSRRHGGVMASSITITEYKS
ncbi:MAG: hypothetical protein GY753_02395, partial [Gammaproteobacteria bacterium]|nr:hypothetical protein [Gammaproteobacteria bacterium]